MQIELAMIDILEKQSSNVLGNEEVCLLVIEGVLCVHFVIGVRAAMIHFTAIH